MSNTQESQEDKYIIVKGARVNNLKNIDLKLPRGRFIVITGLSGSGKSSLAFDTLYAEGQRRYVESLSAYARQFLGRMHKPECDYIKGLPPAIAIEQRVVSRNPRSTVGTSTEIYEYLRLLFARVGHTFSPVSGQEVKRHTPQDVVDTVHTYSHGTRYTVLSPLHRQAGRTLREQLEIYLRQGLSRLDVGGDIVRIEDFMADHPDLIEAAFGPDDEAPSDVLLLIDRLSVSDDKDTDTRLFDSVETAFYEGDGTCMLRFYPARVLHTFSTRFEADGMTFVEPDVNMFSFNSPMGACPTCEGFGRVIGIDEHLVVPDTALSIADGAVVCWRGPKMSMWQKEFCRRAAADKFPIFEPYYKLTRAQHDLLWHGGGHVDDCCIDKFFAMLKAESYKIQNRVMLARYRGKTICPTCGGSRLRPEAGYVKVDGHTIGELVNMPVGQLCTLFDHISLNAPDSHVAARLVPEIQHRLHFLVDVGLGYLTLDRASNTLSGGESQRISLATSLGSSLVGSLYILDEPSIGLHPRDTDRLIGVLRRLRDVGNTVVVVEHDEDTIRAADYIVDIGPEAGLGGGRITWQGHYHDGMKFRPGVSHTLDFLAGLDRIPVPPSRRCWNRAITVRGARANNLKGINVRFPLNVMTVVTGVSGSGKSTLVRTILYPALRRALGLVADTPGEFSALEGDIDAIRGIDFVDQNPIGKSSRSNPVTYVKAYDEIRKLMAAQPLAQQLGFTAAYFSFNAEGGRCEECKGEGTVKVEMQFMADLVLECESCHGRRFKKEVLDVKFEGKSIYDILEMTVDEALAFFTQHGQKAVVKRLRPLHDVGLGYIKLGQPSSSLSGGENQRVKLAYYLGQERVEPTLFIFDEPTTGLHFHDIATLMSSFNALIERGHTIIIIEHNLDVIKCADHIIDLGPEGGHDGGRIVAEGTPEELVAGGKGYTARFLKAKMEEDRRLAAANTAQAGS